MSKRIILLIVYGLLTHLGVMRFFLWLNRNHQTIFTYHNVIPDELFDQSLHLGMSHSQSIFTKQIKVIKQLYKDSFVITFDDGYKNQLEIAAKILKENNLSGIFFITFSMLGQTECLVIDKIMMWLSYVPPGYYTVFNKPISISANNRMQSFAEIYTELLATPNLWNTIEADLNRLYPFSNLKINSQLFNLRFNPLTETDLLQLKQEGHYVAAHSWSHKPLASLTANEQAKDFESCALYANKFCNTKWYSYPYGSLLEVAPVTADLCKKYGFHSAYMNISSPPIWSDVDPRFIQARINLPNEANKYILYAKLSGVEFSLKKLISHLKALIKSLRIKQCNEMSI